MESGSEVAPLIVIVGPTASGKSDAAMLLARRLKGEIICADSRTVYSGMDIGTAKPSRADRQKVPHHLLDVVAPGQPFTAARFKELANIAIQDITNRGKLPIMVGGTGLYVDGVIFDFAFLPPVSTEERERLQNMSIEELQAIISRENIAMPENAQNPRHLVRTIETNGAVAVKKGLRKNTLVLGLEASKEVTTEKIHKRVVEMMERGLKQEVENLAAAYGWDAPGMSAVGYREWRACLEEGLPPSETLQKIETNTLQYAKRQRTWFKRNPKITWVKNSAEALNLALYFLRKK